MQVCDEIGKWEYLWFRYIGVQICVGLFYKQINWDFYWFVG